MQAHDEHYWTKLNSILMVVIVIGLGLIATINLWVPKLVNHILDSQSNGKFVPLSAEIKNY